MSNNPSLGIEFKALNETPVLQSVDRVSRAGQSYLEKWVAYSKSSAVRNEEMYTRHYAKLLNEQDRMLAKQVAAEKKAAQEIEKARHTSTGGEGGLRTGLVNAAAFLSVATRAYYMASQAVGVVSGFVTEAAKWEAMEMGLRNMEGSAEGAARATEHLYELAKAPAIELATATKAYLQLRSLHMAGSDAERVIRNISNTVARSGGGSVEFERVLRQMTQMLAKGKVLEQDLRIMKEAMPELATLMQKAFGETTAEGIRKQGVNAKQFVEAMLLEMEKLPKAQQTLQSEIENTGVAWSRLKAAFVDTDFTKRLLTSFTTTFEEITKILNAKSIDWGRLIMGIWGGNGVSYGAYANAREKDFAEVNSFFDKIEAKDAITGIKAKRGKDYRATDKAGRTRTDWLTFVQSKWDKADALLKPPNSEGVATGKSGTEEGKKKTTKEFKYDLEWWSKQHSDVQAEINKLNREDLLNAEKLLAYYDEMDKKELAAAEERKKAWLEEESAVAKHQRSVDAWNQKQIDKNREKNQAGNALLGEINPLRAIENEYIDHYERINAANFAAKEERDRVNEYFMQKEQQATREFYAAQYSVAVSGASDMFGAMAELRKNATSETDDAYQVMFGISKAFAIADATIKLSSAAINAMAVGSSQGIPVMLANIGTTMAAGGGLISQINATAYAGVFDKGGKIGYGEWGIAGENGPEIIQGPAHVTSTRDTARLIGSGNGAPVINVNNYAGVAVSTKSNRDGSVDILIQRAAEVAEERIASGIASGGGKVAQQMTRTFGVKR